MSASSSGSVRPLFQVFTAAFFICALVVAGIQNAGFNVVLTGLLLAVWEVGTMWLMRRGPHETSVSACLIACLGIL